MTKTIAILTDHEALSAALELELKANSNLEVMTTRSGSANHQETAAFGRIDLIIIVSLLAASEPLVILAKAGLHAKIGRAPLLIISDRPFSPAPEAKIFYLDFPVTLDLISEEVQRILLLEE